MRMTLLAALFVPLALVACGAKHAAYDYPIAAHARFAQGCPTGKPECDCMWDEITRTMTPETFDAAMTRFDEQGLMDPKLTKARFDCRGHK